MQSETSYPAILGRILEHLRKDAGYDQGELADKLGLTQSAWSRIERGQSGLSMEQLVKVSNVLNTKPHNIIADADYATEKLKNDGVTVHPNILTNSDKIIAALSLAALGALVLAILTKK